MAKSRNWWFIAYPESLPEDWIQTLDDRMVPYAISPLHDKDTKPDGTLKKPHYHVMLRYSGPTTFKHVSELTRSLGQQIPQIYDSPSAAYAYLTHSNNPDKAQYDASEIRLGNGFKVPKIEDDDKMSTSKQVTAFVFDNNLTEFSQLVKAVSDIGNAAWFKEIMDHSYFYVQLLHSVRYQVTSAQGALAPRP